MRPTKFLSKSTVNWNTFSSSICQRPTFSDSDHQIVYYLPCHPWYGQIRPSIHLEKRWLQFGFSVKIQCSTANWLANSQNLLTVCSIKPCSLEQFDWINSCRKKRRLPMRRYSNFIYSALGSISLVRHVFRLEIFVKQNEMPLDTSTNWIQNSNCTVYM